MTELSKTWDELRPNDTSDGAYVRLRLPSVLCCAVYAAKRQNTGLEALVVEVATASLPAGVTLSASKGFDLRSEPLEAGRDGRTRLILELAHVRFRDIFHTLCEDLIRSLKAAKTDQSAMREFISRLARWQAFLHRHPLDGLPLEVRRGLYGELSFIQFLFNHGLSPERVIAGWTGYQAASHDFQFASGHVEVKTSSASTPHVFRVSNASQLDDYGIPALFVHLVKVAEGEGGTTTLPDAVEKIRSVLDEHSRAVFDDGLLEAGYTDAHRGLYSTPRYSIQSRRFFRVRDGFPRLLVADLPSGVEDVRYGVAIAACAPFEVDGLGVISLVTPNDKV